MPTADSNKKAIWWGCGLFAAVVGYVLFNGWTDIAVPCPLHFLTGFYCPGCGLTRMLLAILQLDFYQAFRYNPLVFVMLPVATFFYVEYLVAQRRGKAPLQRKVPQAVWVVVIVLILGYGLLRNLPWFGFLAPTVV